MSDVTRLLEIMERLRDPERGCPWDVAQRFETVVPYTLEEAYEVADAIERGDRAALCDELGDLLFQVVFHARMAEEEGAFAFGDVVDAVCSKLVARHPHVFETGSAESPSPPPPPDWEAQKAAEREAAAARAGRRASVVDDVPRALPALARAAKLQRRMAAAGFDWRDVDGMLDKLSEEIGELRAELADGHLEAAARELGDVLFVAANLGRALDAEPETALRAANDRVEARFRHLEARLAERECRPADASDEELARLWREAKARES